MKPIHVLFVTATCFLVSCTQLAETPTEPPFVEYFSATPETITEAGQAATLSWNVTGSYAELSITASIGTSPGPVSGTSIVVFPTNSTVYTLTATNPSGSDSLDAYVILGGGSTPVPTPVPVPEPTEPVGPALEYFLETNCDDGALVTFATVEGGTRQGYYNSGKIYEAFGPFPKANPFVYISAQNQCDSGFVTVTINKFGEPYLTETSEGAYVIATASGSFSD